MVKTRLVKLGGKGLQAAQAHLRYIKRDGVTREGERGALYGPTSDTADGKAFLRRCEGDRHQFRFIVSAEDGSEYEDLKPLTRRLMAQMEQDLETKLEWVAVDHFNTGHPHTHIMLRGKDDRGENLIIAREYISRGMRERLRELVTLDLGPRTDLDIALRLEKDVNEERLTALDRRLLRSVDDDGTVRPSALHTSRQSLEIGRLQKLEQLGLASEVVRGRWQLAPDLEDQLRTLGERGDIIRTMQRELKRQGIDRSTTEQTIYHRSADQQPLVGRVVARGLSDELCDRHFLIVDALDGRSHYVAIGKGEGLDRLAEGAIVRISSATPGIRASDRMVAEVAAANGGRYDVDLHLSYDPNATEEFATTHIRRLEAIRRLTGGVEPDASGTWIIPSDHLARAAEFEARLARDRPVRVQILSAFALDQLVGAQAATWLDRELVSDAAEPLRDSGFGREVRSAQAARRQWLISEGLAEERRGQIAYRADLLNELERREIVRVSLQTAQELGSNFAEAKLGSRVEGRLSRRVDLISGRYALLERSREFTLVPWRPVMERQIGRYLSGKVSKSGISWTIGRQRQGPSVS